MPHFEINTDAFPELAIDNNMQYFKAFMNKEFSGYMQKDGTFYAHDEGDSHWFLKQFLEAKSGKGIYADFFNKKTVIVC